MDLFVMLHTILFRCLDKYFLTFYYGIYKCCMQYSFGCCDKYSVTFNGYNLCVIKKYFKINIFYIYIYS